MKYLIAVRTNPNQIFEFNSKKDRNDFIKDLKSKLPWLQYSTSETKTVSKKRRAKK
jgi:hypothetical protein